MSVTDETWTASTIHVVDQATGKSILRPPSQYDAGPTHARAHLAACAPEMLRMLKSLGRVAQGPGGQYAPEACPVCERSSDDGAHYPDCSLAALIRKAEGR